MNSNIFISHLFRRFWVLALVVLGGFMISSVAYAAPISSSSDGHYYYVEKGDTLSGIAKRYGVSVDELIYFNLLHNPDVIHVGQPIYIPSSSDTSTQDCYSHHKVVHGETLSQIAKYYGVDLHELAEQNDIHDMNHIIAHQVLCIPATIVETTVTPTPEPTITPTITVSESSSELVQRCRSNGCSNAVCDSNTWSSFRCKLNGCCEQSISTTQDSFNRVVIGVVFQTLVPGLSRPMGSATLPVATYDIAIEEQRIDFSPQKALLTGEIQIALVRQPNNQPSSEFQDSWTLFTLDESSSNIECAIADMFWTHTKSNESLPTGVGGKTKGPYEQRLPISKQCTFSPNTSLSQMLKTQGLGSNIDFLITQESPQIYRLYYDFYGLKSGSQGLEAECRAVGCNASICRRDGHWRDDPSPLSCRWVRPLDDWTVPRCCSLWPR